LCGAQSRKRGLVHRKSNISHFNLIAHFGLLKEGGCIKSRTIFLGRYSVATVEFIVGRFGV